MSVNPTGNDGKHHSLRGHLSSNQVEVSDNQIKIHTSNKETGEAPKGASPANQARKERVHEHIRTNLKLSARKLKAVDNVGIDTVTDNFVQMITEQEIQRLSSVWPWEIHFSEQSMEKEYTALAANNEEQNRKAFAVVATIALMSIVLHALLSEGGLLGGMVAVSCLIAIFCVAVYALGMAGLGLQGVVAHDILYTWMTNILAVCLLVSIRCKSDDLEWFESYTLLVLIGAMGSLTSLCLVRVSVCWMTVLIPLLYIPLSVPEELSPDGMAAALICSMGLLLIWGLLLMARCYKERNERVVWIRHRTIK